MSTYIYMFQKPFLPADIYFVVYVLPKAKLNRAETKVHLEPSVPSSKFPLIELVTISAISLSRGLCALTIGARRFPFFFWRDPSRKLLLHFFVWVDLHAWSFSISLPESSAIFPPTLPLHSSLYLNPHPSRINNPRPGRCCVYSSFTRLTTSLSDVENLYASL